MQKISEARLELAEFGIRIHKKRISELYALDSHSTLIGDAIDEHDLKIQQYTEARDSRLAEQGAKHPEIVISMSRNIVNPKFGHDFSGCLHVQGITDSAVRVPWLMELNARKTEDAKRLYLQTLFTVTD